MALAPRMILVRPASTFSRTVKRTHPLNPMRIKLRTMRNLLRMRHAKGGLGGKDTEMKSGPPKGPLILTEY